MRAMLLIVATGLLLGGCAKEEIKRLGAGDCAVVIKDSEVITVGSSCKIERMYR